MKGAARQPVPAEACKATHIPCTLLQTFPFSFEGFALCATKQPSVLQSYSPGLESHTSLACDVQVVMMLKSSDRVAHDIDLLQQQAQQPATAPATNPAALAPGAVPAVLALRRWYPALRPEREFRCFVRQGTLLGASQRDISQHFPQLAAGDADSGSDSGDDERRCERPDGATNAEGEHAGSSGSAEGSGSGHLRRIRRAIQEFHCMHIGPRFRLTQCKCHLQIAAPHVLVSLAQSIEGASRWLKQGQWCVAGAHLHNEPRFPKGNGPGGMGTAHNPMKQLTAFCGRYDKLLINTSTLSFT